jgi:hypothetical protein
MLKVESINQTLRQSDGITAIRVEGSFLVLTYGGLHQDTDVYLNDQGREVLKVTRPHHIHLPPSVSGFWFRLRKLITRS